MAHNLHVIENTRLAELYRSGSFSLQSRDEYVSLAADFLEPGRRHRGAEDRALLDAALRGEVALEELFRRVLARKIAALLERGRPLHPRSLEAWNAACSADPGSRA